MTFESIAAKRVSLKEAWRRIGTAGLTYRALVKRIVHGWAFEKAIGLPCRKASRHAA